MPQPFGDLVVLLPGILGSRLVRRAGGKDVTVWDLSIKRLPRLLWEAVRGGLVLEGNGIDPPNDGIEAADLFSYQLLPGFFSVDDYASIVDALKRGVGDAQLITFPYDWRLSNRHAAKRLETTAIDALKQWREKSGNRDGKLWLICHSMGGLVARYFCEHLGGHAYTRAVVTIGTPHRGSVKALDRLVNGIHYGPINLTSLIRSLPSAYELLPLFPVLREEHDDRLMHVHRIAEIFGLDPITGEEVREPDVAPLPGIDRAMLRRALEFHRDIRVPATSRADNGEVSPYRQFAFFNRRQRTPLSARMKPEELEILETYPEQHGEQWIEEDSRGDGTIPAFSSVPIEWPDTQQAVAVGEKHTAMQAVIAVQDTIFNWLRPLDARGKRGGPTPDHAVIALGVPPALNAGEDLVVSASALVPLNCSIEMSNVETNAVAAQPVALTGDDAVSEITFRGLPQGTYRVTAKPADPMKPEVHDYVLVIAPA
jgi:pimeloyl-ACP methyl ester carboxylesterase